MSFLADKDKFGALESGGHYSIIQMMNRKDEQVGPDLREEQAVAFTPLDRVFHFGTFESVREEPST